MNRLISCAYPLAFGMGLTLTTIAVTPERAAAQNGTSYYACFVPDVGAMYLIKIAGLPDGCLSETHVEITWSEGGDGTVADNAITTEKIANGTITSDDIGDGQVDTPDIAPSAITGSRLAPGAVEPSHIADGAVGENHILPGVVTSNHLAASAVTLDWGFESRVVDLLPGASASLDVPCVTGRIAVGGGWQHIGFPTNDVFVQESFPVHGDTWRFRFQNDNADLEFSIRGFVACIQVTP